MVGWQSTTPGKGESQGGNARAKLEAIGVISTTAPIIDGIAELDHTAGTARRDMERRRVGHRYIRAAAHTGYRRRADRHVYRGHFERHQRRGWWHRWRR